MANKTSKTYLCLECSYKSSQWLGRCPECGQWNSLEEEMNLSIKSSLENIDTNLPVNVSNIKDSELKRYKTSIGEFDRVLGGGIVLGSLILIGGEPGIGKSTLLAEVLGSLSSKLLKDKVLYISSEESVQQVAQRVKRLGLANDNFFLLNETSWEKISVHLKKFQPKFIVLDSIQTTTSEKNQSTAGTISQVRDVTCELMEYVKSHSSTIFMVGHITKDGAIAGPKFLEHMVDTVVYFEGDRFGLYRILRAIKNRFGNTNEAGLFEMNEKGLREVKNPSQYFLMHNKQAIGSTLTCIIEGNLPLFIEIQTLVVENKTGSSKRTSQGIDNNRLSMLIAVIEKYINIPLNMNDVYLNVVGGPTISTRESDLSIVASLISSYESRPVKESTIFLGEVGLSGEVRGVAKVESRLKEIQQLKYQQVVLSQSLAMEYKGKFNISMVGINKIEELIEYI
jgi:DNA repair protein RadA/Sms